MTFKELFEATKLVDPKDCIIVNFRAGKYFSDEFGGPRTWEDCQWSLYSTTLKENYYSPTAQGVHDQYVAAMWAKAPSVVAEEIEKVSL